MSNTAPASSVAMAVRGVSKSFGSVQVLHGASFSLHRGEIHALLGGNGSGKSTMIKILAGVHQASAGEIEIGGDVLDARATTPALARRHGLHFVHQQNSMFAGLTVAENLAVGTRFPTNGVGGIRWATLRKRSMEVLERFGVSVDPRTRLGDLGPATQAMISIARALQDQEEAHDGVLVLDEPTASLPHDEVQLLLTALQRYADAGQTILFVTHRLDEVLQVVDRATILRDGRVAMEMARDDMSHASLVESILGRKLEAELEQRGAAHAGDVLLQVDGLSAGPIHDASFSVRKGEIVGLAGIIGSGRSTLLRSLFGDIRSTARCVMLEGTDFSASSPREAIEAGVVLIPEDRLREAAFVGMDLVENLGISTTGEYFDKGRLAKRRERLDAKALMSSYFIKAASIDSPLGTLSGGNQQKVILARWMRRRPKLMLLDEPTQGVDVGARAEIWRLVRVATADGAGALVVSSDFEELARVCDRVLVIRNGQVVAEVGADELSEDSVTQLTLVSEAAS